MKGKIVKKALALFVLLSLAMIPKHASPEMESEARGKTTTGMILIGRSFAERIDELSDAFNTLREIGDAGSNCETTDFYACVSTVHTAVIILYATTDMLPNVISTRETHTETFYENLRTHLERGKEFLNEEYRVLKISYSRIENKAALHNLDKAKDIMRESLKLYDMALALLPPEK